MKYLSFLFVVLQRVFPKVLVSKWFGIIAHRKFKWFHYFIIKHYIRVYGVSLEDAELKSIKDYDNFSKFFTRRLIASKRPITMDENILVSPCDGIFSQYKSPIKHSLIQAKGMSFDVEQLLQQPNIANTFRQGSQFTIYLAPKDYHRVHMPYDGVLKSMLHIPGNRYSVNQMTASHIKNLFCENERVVAYFESPIGHFALVFVGALVVGSIHTAWSGVVKNPSKKVKQWDYEAIHFSKGEEVGFFTIGSTIILLTEQPCSLQSTNLLNGPIQFGQPLATCQPG